MSRTRAAADQLFAEAGADHAAAIAGDLVGRPGSKWFSFGCVATTASSWLSRPIMSAVSSSSGVVGSKTSGTGGLPNPNAYARRAVALEELDPADGLVELRDRAGGDVPEGDPLGVGLEPLRAAPEEVDVAAAVDVAP